MAPAGAHPQLPTYNLRSSARAETMDTMGMPTAQEENDEAEESMVMLRYSSSSSSSSDTGGSSSACDCSFSEEDDVDCVVEAGPDVDALQGRRSSCASCCCSATYSIAVMLLLLLIVILQVAGVGLAFVSMGPDACHVKLASMMEAFCTPASD